MLHMKQIRFWEKYKMFEDYLQDAHNFLEIAEKYSKSSNDREARRYFRGSVFYISSAIEAFVNYIAGGFKEAGNVDHHETNFLNDLVETYSVKDGVKERQEFHRIDEKIRLLINKFVPNFNFQDPMWSHFMEFKLFRDSLVHPRIIEDELPLESYKKKVRAGLKATINIINSISQGVYKRPLRRQILDLMPD